MESTCCEAFTKPSQLAGRAGQKVRRRSTRAAPRTGDGSQIFFNTDVRSILMALLAFQRYCSPTRSSFLSGRLPYHDHQTNAGLFGGAFGTNVNMTLLPAKLQAAGYRTAARGKWHLGFAREEYLPAARGFEDYAGYLMGGCDHFTETSHGAVDSWRSDSFESGPDHRNGTKHAHLNRMIVFHFIYFCFLILG